MLIVHRGERISVRQPLRKSNGVMSWCGVSFRNDVNGHSKERIGAQGGRFPYIQPDKGATKYLTLWVHFGELPPSLSQIVAGGYNAHQIVVWYYDCQKISYECHEWEMNNRDYWGYIFSRARLCCMNCQRMYLAPLLTSVPPVYSGKYWSRGTWRNEIFLNIN